MKAHLAITRTITDHNPLELSNRGDMTIGEAIDRHLQKALAAGHIVQDIRLTFEEEVWRQMSEDFFAKNETMPRTVVDD